MERNKLKEEESTDPKIVVDLIVPQMGEGLQEVKIVRFLKKAGDWINEEEIVYEMETDKTTVEIESPFAGRLLKLLVKEGDKLPVGAPLGQLEIKRGLTHGVEKKNTSVTISLNTTGSTEEISEIKKELRGISPRTRAYCKEKGISQEEILKIPIDSGKLMPTDVDKYLESKQKNISCLPENIVQIKKSNYHEFPLSPQQQLLNQRFKRSQLNVVPATVVGALSIDELRAAMWQLISNNKMVAKNQGFISEFQIFAYIVSKVCSELPKFRSILINPTKGREYKHVNLGIALETEAGDLATAVILEADKLELKDFVARFRQQVQSAFIGEDQGEQSPHILLSYMGQSGILSGTPLLVEPAVATLFLGNNYCDAGKMFANLSLTFEHRLINGLVAAKFLQRISEVIQGLAIPATAKKNDARKENFSSNKLPKSPDLGEFQQWLLQKISSLLNKNIYDIDKEESFGLQGMDSLRAVKLANNLTEHFGETISPTVIWHHSTYVGLIKHLRERFNLGNEEEQYENEAKDLDNLTVELEGLPSDVLENLWREVKDGK